MQLLRLFSYVAVVLAAVGSVLCVTGSDLIRTSTGLKGIPLKAVNNAYDVYGADFKDVSEEIKQYILTDLQVPMTTVTARYAELNKLNDAFRNIQITGKKSNPSLVSRFTLSALAMLTILTITS